MKAIDVAKYFLSKDKDKKLFTKEVIFNNGRNFYSGNARLNKYLHLSQNVYIALTGEKLFDDDLYAYDNGGVVPEVANRFPILFDSDGDYKIDNDNIKAFLDKIYRLLENATIDELIELSHEDEAWQEKSNNYYLKDERMDTLKYKNMYKEQYSDVLKIMERI